MRKLIIAVLFSTLAVASYAGEPQYELSYKISRAGTMIASPSLIVKAGKTATISLNGGEPDSVELSISPRMESDSVVFIAHDITIGTDSFSPWVKLALDEKGSIQLGDLKIDLVVTNVIADEA